MNNKVYMVNIMRNGVFYNYLGDKVYSSEEDAINEVKRIYELFMKCEMYKYPNAVIEQCDRKAVRIVNGNDVILWTGYSEYEVI